MSTIGSGSLGIMGINPIPIGTLDELKKLGLDVGSNGSCAPSAGLPGHERGVRGCPVWDKCRFHLKKMGGFKGQGPRNVGYYLRTHEGHQKEDDCACFRFVMTLQGRMDAGIRDRQEGKNGEIIQIIAQEGEMIQTRVVIPKNPNDHRLEAEHEIKRETKAVSKFPRPGEFSGDQLSYEAALEKRRMEREMANPENETGMPQRVTEETKDDAWDLEMPKSEATATAEPVSGKRSKS